MLHYHLLDIRSQSTGKICLVANTLLSELKYDQIQFIYLTLTDYFLPFTIVCFHLLLALSSKIIALVHLNIP